MNGRYDWLELFTSSTGRLARGPFLIIAAALVVLAALYEASTVNVLRWLTGWIVYPALLFVGAVILAKRLHDRGRSGWWTGLIILALIVVWPLPTGFIDFIGVLVLVWAAVELGVLPGEQGANRYGPNPLRLLTT